MLLLQFGELFEHILGVDAGLHRFEVPADDLDLRLVLCDFCLKLFVLNEGLRQLLLLELVLECAYLQLRLEVFDRELGVFGDSEFAMLA